MVSARGLKCPGKIEDVAHRGGAEGIDRLRVVADHGEAAPVRLQPEQDRGLQPVGVLIFVDQHVVEAPGEVGGDRGLAHHLRPVEQQVVVIEHVLALLGLDIGGEQRLQLGVPAGTPREGAADHLLQRLLGIHRAGIDGDQRALGGKALLGPGEAELVAHEVDEVGAVLAVMDGEVRVEADLHRIVAQEPCADAVEGAGEGQPFREHGRIRPEHMGGDALDAARSSRPPRGARRSAA